MKQLLAIILAASISLSGCVCLGAGWAYEFDGVDDYVRVNDAPSLSFGNGVTDRPFSISYWANMTDATSFYAVSKAAVDATGQLEWSLGTSGGDAVQMVLYDNTSGVYIFGRAIMAVTSDQGEWHHYGMTYNGGGSISDIKIYRDGVDVTGAGGNNGSYVAMHDTSADLADGAFLIDSAAVSYASGSVRHVRINDKVLPPAEIRGLYKAGGGRNDFGSLSIVLPRADDQSLVFSLDRPVTAASTGDVLAEDAVITSKDAARNYGLAKGGVTVGPAAIALPAP